MDPEMQQMAMNLTEALVRNTASSVSDKVAALKQRGKDRETINGLEELVNDLIADKAEIARIAQTYQEELVAQRISPEDIEYITKTVVPLIKKFASINGEDQTDLIETVSSLISAETVNVLQILGFNFRKAIGEPLTSLVERAIIAKAPVMGPAAEDLQTLQVQRENLLYQLALDPEATARLKELIGRRSP
ncbi:MAG: hypothetical protein QM621_05360 [Aeromicrobium sp.]|uniref:hypothetical protein n=1 Tax=Aeromicrobium sp. TaxID=1871063 RepID=UPI0039E392E1